MGDIPGLKKNRDIHIYCHTIVRTLELYDSAVDKMFNSGGKEKSAPTSSGGDLVKCSPSC